MRGISLSDVLFCPVYSRLGNSVEIVSRDNDIADVRGVANGDDDVKHELDQAGNDVYVLRFNEAQGNDDRADRADRKCQRVEQGECGIGEERGKEKIAKCPADEDYRYRDGKYDRRHSLEYDFFIL